MQCLHEPLAAGADAIQLRGQRSGGECFSCFNLPGMFALCRSLHGPSPDFDVLVCCVMCCGFLFAGLQAAALEAERQRGERGPGLEESATVQRLDVRKLRGGRHFVFLCCCDI